MPVDATVSWHSSAGSMGVLTGPVIAAWLRRLGRLDAPLLVAMFGAACATLSLAALPFATSGMQALAAIASASFCVTLPLALITTTMQEVTPNAMRGVVNGFYVVTTNVLGLALGPTLVAASTDYLYKDPSSVALSLTTVSLVYGADCSAAAEFRSAGLRLAQTTVVAKPGSVDLKFVEPLNTLIICAEVLDQSCLYLPNIKCLGLHHLFEIRPILGSIEESFEDRNVKTRQKRN